MNYYLFRPTVIFALTAFLLLASCSETNTPKTEFVRVTSLAELNSLFSKLDYTSENWNTAEREIPRMTFEGINEKWVTGSSQLPVNIKKTVFFRLMMPLILIANEKVLTERKIVKTASLDDKELANIAVKYRIINDDNVPMNEGFRTSLMSRVDILPVSLGLAQSAEESGWGTSRFAFEGNALFGQWDFTGNGMRPKLQRKALGNYGVAKFDSPLDSVEAYMFNINTNAAYQKLRTLRAELRSSNNGYGKVSGYQLALTLDKYSERGDAYAQGLRQLIRYNKLQSTDGIRLADGTLLHLKTKH